MKELGGFLKLENGGKNLALFKNLLALNTGRFCLKYIIRAENIKKIFVPNYICPTVTESIKNEGCEVFKYGINEKMLPENQFDKNDFILYVNYFGLCAKNTKLLSKKYKNLIVDNAQSFFMPLKYGHASFNSIRKFIGTPDGAFLKCKSKLNTILKQDISYKRAFYLLKEVDMGQENTYGDFCLAEKAIDSKGEIKLMSNLSKRLFAYADLKEIKRKRRENFILYQKLLKDKNDLSFNLDKDDVPMFYPFLKENENLSEILIQNKIFTAPFWADINGNPFEEKLKNFLLPLPLCQNTNKEDIKRVVEIINKVIK